MDHGRATSGAQALRYRDSAYEEEGLEDDDVDESVKEDMRKLEESFPRIKRYYRLINRIGEGTAADSTSLSTRILGCLTRITLDRNIFNGLQSRRSTL